ncbi:DNA polymerase III subunit delta [Bacillus thuringiensis serovar roskildiensis]|uniref:DNA polymerase III subunit delta n=1 Tax=Bacillus thuringiensis serovar sooncheon TaxID=180891 RepID=A0A9Q5SGY6_BACTU|nr:DNA polymerase III subunit delta [Bacillus thuringiensis serovar coreanensis]OTX43594.1 DNA polymerase III subunit delta [Bacillus thuringiensis serovar sooncheon]OTX51901.1 DNA polymerase III subunit delta [Bacillus thuringiensis serovar guiyangiensis]OTX70289.1 DNA polymerase III subunit delta [Bacillus thuringiensis serovar roskildiensis]
MKKRIICFVFSSFVLSLCSFQQTMQEEKPFVRTTGGTMDRVTDPIPLKELPKYFPVKYKVPAFLPYDIMSNVKGEVRTIGTKKAVLMIKYKQREPGRNEYIELNVANFPYSFPYIVDEKRFQEQMKLNNGAFAYFKNKDGSGQGDEFATLIWKEKGLEYQLLYRNAQENDQDVITKNLLYIANNME